MKTYLICKVGGRGGAGSESLNQKNLPHVVFAFPGPPWFILNGGSKVRCGVLGPVSIEAVIWQESPSLNGRSYKGWGSPTCHQDKFLKSSNYFFGTHRCDRRCHSRLSEGIMGHRLHNVSSVLGNVIQTGVVIEWCIHPVIVQEGRVHCDVLYKTQSDNSWQPIVDITSCDHLWTRLGVPSR